MLNSNPGEKDPTSPSRGREAFLNNCTQCHGENADGKGPDALGLAIPPTNFKDPAYSKAAIRLAAHIAYGKGDEMPAFENTLPYETIWDIANYLHSLQEATPAKG